MAIIKDFVVKSGLVVQGTATSISTSSGALLVGGGAGIGENLNVAGVGRFGLDTAVRGTGSTSTTTVQTVRITGGAGIVGDSLVWGGLGVTGQTFFRDPTEAISTQTASVTLLGGLGVGKNIYAGGLMYSRGSEVITTATLATFGITTIIAGTDTAVNTSTGAITIWNTSNLQTITNRGSTTNQAIRITNTTAASSTNTGALIVDGGIGTGGAIFARSTITTQASLSVGTTANFGSTLDATSLTTASVTLAGGLAVAKTIYAQTVDITSTDQSVSAVGSNALAVLNGGLGVAGSGLFGGNVVMQSATSSANTNSGQALLVTGGVGVGGNLAATSINVQSSTLATTAGAGSFKTNGGAFIGQNLIVNSTASSTTTNEANALYVKGAAWFDSNMFIKGTATFDGNVVFNGTQTNVYSTNTVYTDNILNLHVPVGSTGTDHNWSFDDGKDIGLAFHYYKTQDKNAFLGLANDSGYLEWYDDGYESTTGIHTSGTYGTFKLGSIILVNATANTANTNSGALQVLGGVGINRTVYVGGVGGTASSSTVNQQSLIVAGGGLGVTGDSHFANNLRVHGSAGLHVTANIGAGGIIEIAGGTGTSTNLSSQGLRVTTGGIGVNGDSYLNGNIQVTGITRVTSTQAATSTATGALQVAGGAGIGGNLYVGGTIVGTLSGSATTASNLAGGAQGSIPIQSANGATAFIPLGPVGYILTAGATTATWQNAGSLSSGTATNSINVLVTSTDVTSKEYFITFASTTTGFAPLATDTDLTYNPVTNVFKFNGTDNSTTSTNGAVVVAGGIGVAKAIVVGGALTAYGDTQVLSSTAATNNTTGALRVNGGVGVQGSVYAAQLYDNSNRVVTSVTPTAGAGIAITSLTSGGPSAAFTIENFGVRTLTAGTDTAVSSNTGTIVVWNTGTLQSVTSRGATTNAAISITNATQSTTTATGALTVAGGVGVGLNLNIGGTLTRSGNISAAGWLANGIGITAPAFTATDTSLTGSQGQVAIHSLGQPTVVATGGTPTYSTASTLYIADAPVAGAGATITGAYALWVNNGNVRINASTTSTTPTTGALQVTGGVGVGGAVVAGGSVTAGTAATGQVVNGFISNNSLVATYNSTAISTTSTVNLDTWSVSAYRTAKYMVQLVDTGFTPNRVHATEMMVFHDGSSNVYKSEYGVVTSAGELGTFDAVIVSTNVQLQFTPSFPTLTPSNLVIKIYRTAITL